jgi:hypothetical protein
MRLYVEPMDVTIVDIDREGHVRCENEGWITPSLQERRAIIYAATKMMEELDEIIEILQKGTIAERQD